MPSNSPSEAIRSFIARLRLRLLAVRLATGVIAALGICAFCGLLAVVWNRLWGESLWASFSYLTFFLTLAILGCWWFWIKPFLREPLAQESLALRLERVFPRLDSRLISALQFERRRGDASREFVEALGAGVAKDLEKLPTAIVFRWRYVGWICAIALILCAACTWIEWRWPGRLRSSVMAIANTSAVHERLNAWARHLSPASDWSVGNLTVEYVYPAYTSLAPKTVGNTDGNLEALKGTVVRLRAVSSEPLSAAKLEFQHAEAVVLRLEHGGREMVGEVTLTQEDTYRYTVELHRGGKRKSPQTYRIQVLQDLSPRVTLLEPAQDQSLQEASTLEVKYSVEDDYGLQNLQLHVRKTADRRKPAREIALRAFAKNQTQDAGTSSWSLKDLSLAPGDEVEFFLRVFDNDTVSGPKFSDSAIRKISILSPQKIRQDLLARQDQVFEALVGILADLLERGPKESPAAIAAGIGTLVQGLAEVEKAFAQNAPAQPGERVTPKSFSGLRDRLTAVQSQLSEPGAGEGMGEKRWTQVRQEIERLVLLFEQIIYGQRMDDLMADGKRLEERFKDLQKRLENAKNGDDQAVKEALEEFEKAYQEYMERMAKAMGAQPIDEFVNADALREMQEQSVSGGLEKIREMLAKGDLAGARKEMERLQKEFSEGLSQAQSSDQQGQKKMAAEVAQAMQKLDELIAGQQKLLQKTENLEKKVRQGQDRAQEKVVDEFRKRQIARIEGIRADLKNFRIGFQQESRLRDLWGTLVIQDEELRDNLENLQKRFEQGQLTQARDDVINLMNRLERYDVSAQAIERFAHVTGDLAEEKRAPLDRAMKKAGEIADDLENLLKREGPPLSAEQKNEMMQMQKGEQGLRKRSMEIADQMNELGKKIPSISDRPFGDEKGAERFPEMKGAAERLGKGDVSGSVPEVRNGLFRLQKAREKIREALQEAGRSGSGPGMMLLPPSGQSGGSASSAAPEHVEIPGPDASKSAEEFRKEILDAMKQKSPEGYEKLTRDYYEDLVR